MKKYKTLFLVLLLGGVAGLLVFVVGYSIGHRHGRFQAALEECKIASVCLSSKELELSPDFREYLKGRIYYNIATKFPDTRGYLLRADWDFGPVDHTKLKSRVYAKDPAGESESFDDATRGLMQAEPIRSSQPP